MDGIETAKVQTDIEWLLRERRSIAPGKEDDFSVRDMKQIAQATAGTTTMLTGLLGAVAAVSLLVGGIGIMNIMLVSVTERTREIGIRLAIGALESQVLAQFLVEAVVLSLLGGLIGILLGLGLAGLATRGLAGPFHDRPVHRHRSVCLFRGRRHRVWLFPGAAGGTARSDRGPAARIAGVIATSSPSGSHIASLCRLPEIAVRKPAHRLLCRQRTFTGISGTG